MNSVYTAASNLVGAIKTAGVRLFNPWCSNTVSGSKEPSNPSTTDQNSSPNSILSENTPTDQNSSPNPSTTDQNSSPNSILSENTPTEQNSSPNPSTTDQNSSPNSISSENAPTGPESGLGFEEKSRRGASKRNGKKKENGDGNSPMEKKRKRDEMEVQYEADVTNEEAGIGISVVGEKRKKIDYPEDLTVKKEDVEDEAKLLRTVFVMNIQLKKKEIFKEFGKFGEVESVMIRSVDGKILRNRAVIKKQINENGKILRKHAVIKKQINQNGASVHAYIVFKNEESAKASLAHNMAVVGGNHIRVDRACPPHKKMKGDDSPNKRTVFVGNLPFDVKDEEIYNLFCGIKNIENSVEGVRVIRDPGSSLGKGIAYVLFKTTDAANLVVKKHSLRLRDRELRLSHAKSTDTLLKRKATSQPQTTYSDKLGRKEKALRAANAPQVAGMKRKTGNRTRESSEHKKARKFFNRFWVC